MAYSVWTVSGCVLLFVTMCVMAMCGEWLARRRSLAAATGGEATITAGAVFALLGLLLGFSYSGAFARLDTRRSLIVDEANAIGTAYLRLDLLPESTREPIRKKFRLYAECRAAHFHSPDDAVADSELMRAAQLHADIWNDVVNATKDADPTVRLLLLPAVNEMIDISTARHAAAMTHNPMLVIITLVVVALISSGLAGLAVTANYGQHRLTFMAFAAVVAFSLYMIMDIEYPRTGLVRLDAINQLLLELPDTKR